MADLDQAFDIDGPIWIDFGKQEDGEFGQHADHHCQPHQR